jgi:hypothetical protein
MFVTMSTSSFVKVDFSYNSLACVAKCYLLHFCIDSWGDLKVNLNCDGMETKTRS